MRLRNNLILGLSALAGKTTGQLEFDWDSVTPTTDLQYHDCFSAFKCARLKLPLDWKNTTDPRTVSIAIVKLPAKVPDNDPTFGGPIFTNPGGPGGSGVSLVVGRGRYLQDYVDTPGKKHYEIISFDPRGIANSAPLANCYPGSSLARDGWMLERRGNGGLDQGLTTVSYALAMFDSFGKRCEKADAEGLNGGEIFKYMGTPSVARDMVAMVDSIAALRKREAGGDERSELKKREEEDVPRLQYIGFSYGTILGNYFSSLFPERIGRVILDGVCNADDYATGAGWLTNTVDSDEIFDNFIEGCFKAGHKVCALGRPDDKSASDISRRFWTWLKQLDESPISGVGPAGASLVLTGADIRVLIAQAVYTPVRSFIQLAELLNNAMAQQNYETIFAVIEASLGGPLQDACPVANQTAKPFQSNDAQTGVICLDGEGIHGKKPSWWTRYVAKQVSQSTIFGSYWSGIRIPCSGWRFKPSWSFHGPFTSPKPSKTGEKPVKGKPAAPLMFLTNRLDPVTPLSAARAMAAKHPGARVVVQEAMGHCATFSAYSECTKRVVAEYFDTGRLPDGEKRCGEVKCGPWDVGCEVGAADEGGEKWFRRLFPLGI